MSGIAGGNVVVQVGFVVRDIYETKKRWAQFLGVEEPPVGDSGEYAVTHTQYKGEDAPEAKSLLAFFNFPGFQIELIQPNEAPSTWREFLDTMERESIISLLTWTVCGWSRPLKTAGISA